MIWKTEKLWNAHFRCQVKLSNDLMVEWSRHVIDILRMPKTGRDKIKPTCRSCRRRSDFLAENRKRSKYFTWSTKNGKSGQTWGHETTIHDLDSEEWSLPHWSKKITTVVLQWLKSTGRNLTGSTYKRVPNSHYQWIKQRWSWAKRESKKASLEVNQMKRACSANNGRAPK